MSFAYEHGLRGPRCNGCRYAQLEHELGDKFLALGAGSGWIKVYELDCDPAPGQGEPQEHDGRSIRYRVGFMAIGHSDECYNWKPPE